MNEIGRLRRVALREVWPHEAYDFTKWLQDNLELLNDELGFDLASAEPEQEAGDFNVDLIAEDHSGNLVIIENQLERSDHDHLGKLITYLSVVGAETAIWIVAEPRQEHVSAISWLNESSSGNFYLVKVEAIQIGESSPAPLLTLLAGPSAEVREASETKREFSERHMLRKQFWTELLERANQKTRLHSNISPSTNSWVGTGGGISGLALNYVVRKHNSSVELYIDRGKEGKEENKQAFDFFFAAMDDIENTFGGPLNWERLDDKRASRIGKTIPGGGYRDESFEKTHDAMIDAMIRLEQALRPHIDRLEL